MKLKHAVFSTISLIMIMGTILTIFNNILPKIMEVIAVVICSTVLVAFVIAIMLTMKKDESDELDYSVKEDIDYYNTYE